MKLESHDAPIGIARPPFRDVATFRHHSFASPSWCRFVGRMVSRRARTGASTQSSFISTRSKWKCMACHRQYSAKVGTIFEIARSAMINGFLQCGSSPTQRTALALTSWRARLASRKRPLGSCSTGFASPCRTAASSNSKATFEVDETYIGGKARFMHKNEKLSELGRAQGQRGKEIVQGLLDRKKRESAHDARPRFRKGHARRQRAR